MSSPGAHAWACLGTFHGPAPNIASSTHYLCSHCLALFCHYYEVDQNIFEALKRAEVPEKCPGPLKDLETHESARLFVSRTLTLGPDAETRPVTCEEGGDRDHEMHGS